MGLVDPSIVRSKRGLPPRARRCASLCAHCPACFSKSSQVLVTTKSPVPVLVQMQTTFQVPSFHRQAHYVRLAVSYLEFDGSSTSLTTLQEYAPLGDRRWCFGNTRSPPSSFSAAVRDPPDCPGGQKLDGGGTEGFLPEDPSAPKRQGSSAWRGRHYDNSLGLQGPEPSALFTDP